jgi:hypothetical protein
MITEQEYRAALELIEQYVIQQKQEINYKLRHLTGIGLNRGDYVRFIGGSESKYLIKGNSYRLTGEPFSIFVTIIGENGKRKLLKQSCFERI